MNNIIAQLAQEIRVHANQVRAAVALLDSGATVPFIARYRKEATAGLDDVQLRELEYRLGYLRELQDRREAILESIEVQGKLTPELRQALISAPTKQELEDLYLPYKPKRRSKGQIALEAGIEPLANQLFADPSLNPNMLAQTFVKSSKGEDGSDFTTVQAVLDGVRDLLAERWAEDATLVRNLRDWLWAEGVLQAKLIEDRDPNSVEAGKFRDYFDYSERINRVPSHRALAVLRGRTLELLDVKLLAPVVQPLAGATESAQSSKPAAVTLAEGRIARHLGWSHQGRAGDDLLRKCVAWTWRVKLSLSTERELLSRLREAAEKVAIQVFADNLRDLLLAAPAGPRVVLGLDPGIRTGVKVAVVDATGKLVDTATVFPHEPRRDWDGALHVLARLCETHAVTLIAIGNGTASRETDQLAGDLIQLVRQAHLGRGRDWKIDKVMVSEAGASVYSASEFASQEMPDVDVSLRGAASIARRLQDPLAELVKIDPKSIGVGQYQHDVNQSELARSLNSVVEDCVNLVGVDLNTASVPLLSRVSGLSAAAAKAVVRWREGHGAFRNRQQLLEVTGLGAKTFEQCAGFLRIRGGTDALDMTGVHPESYAVVEKILSFTRRSVSELMGQTEILKSLVPEVFADQRVGVVTVQDILGELEKPGRDPRPSFKVARFSEAVRDIRDLREAMVLEGVVSNVAAFGAFVDLGVHQDGLVHVSQLSHRFVTDAREVVKTGDVVRVRVVEVDVQRKRIGLSMKLDTASSVPKASRSVPSARDQAVNGRHTSSASEPSAMACAFAKLQARPQ